MLLTYFLDGKCQVELIIYMLTEIKNFFLQSQLEKVSFYVDFYLK